MDWLCDYGDQLVDEVQDKADALLAALRTLAANRVADMEARQVAATGAVDAALSSATAEIARLKADAADAVTEKRKEVMYKIKDLKIEIGTTFKKAAKADKKAQIESLVSELESFINKTIRDYDEAVADQLAVVQSAASAATTGLETERDDAIEAFQGAKDPAEADLDTLTEEKLEALAAAFEAKEEDATEVYTYLNDNYARYLQELLDHILADDSQEDRDYLLSTALNPSVKVPFLSEVQILNQSLQKAMTKKLKAVKDDIGAVKAGRVIQHQHNEDGRIATDTQGNKIVIAPAIEGFIAGCLAVGDKMHDDLDDILNDQADDNKAAVKASEDADDAAAEWLGEATHNELGILADFLEKGFAFHVDTSDFVQHTANPYAPFSTGAYNELVDQINGFEQFFHYWKRTRERAVDTLATCKAQEKASVSAQVFEVDVPALEAEADGLLVRTQAAEQDAALKGEGDVSKAKAADTAAREALEGQVTTSKAKIFREIGFQVKKLYRATREEYKERIKGDLESSVATFDARLTAAREELAARHEATAEEFAAQQSADKAAFRSQWVSAQLAAFDDYDQANSPAMVQKLEWFRDDIMDAKLATARAEVDAGLTKKERDIKAAYEAVKLSISKIDDHHFQYNVRTLLEDAKAEADRRCAHEEHDTGAIIDGIEQWVWDFTEESVARVEEKVRAERAALAEGLNAAADRAWEEAQEHGEILAQHQAHEKTALEFFLKDCVKGLKHLFNRYGYVSPAFAAVEHQHGFGQPHQHVAANVDAEKLVHTLGPNGRDDHAKPAEADYDAQEAPEELESRSSCTGSSCANPLEIDHDHAEIQLDSLEDLAHVIDDEIIHRTNDHVHVPPKEQKVREYEPFIVQEEAVADTVDVAPIHAPTKEEIEAIRAEDLLKERQATQYEEIALPSFAPITYNKPAKKEEPVHYVKPEPTPVKVAPPAPPKLPEVDDVWGSYNASWKTKSSSGSRYANIVAPSSEPWKPTTFQPFDVSKYLLRGARKAAPASTGTAVPWWEAQPTAAPKTGLPWWEALTQDLPEEAPSTPTTTSYRPAYKPYVPRSNTSTYSTRATPAVTYSSGTKKAGKPYWWM